MSNANNMQDFRDLAANPQKRESLLSRVIGGIMLKVFGFFLLTFGATYGVLAYFETGKQGTVELIDAASQQLSTGTFGVSSYDFDGAMRACTRRNKTRAKNTGGNSFILDSVKSVAENPNPRTFAEASIIRCVGRGQRYRMCAQNFHSRFVGLVNKYYRSRAMTEFTMKFAVWTKDGDHSKANLPLARRGPVGNTVRYLFLSGHLQREDFTSSIFGEPQWMKDMLGSRTLPPRPCKGR